MVGDWRYAIGVLVLLAGVAFVAYTLGSPYSGYVWLYDATHRPLPEFVVVDLASLATTTLNTALDDATPELIKDATQAPDGTLAYLSKHDNSWQVVLVSTAHQKTILTDTPTLKRDLVWASDGLSLAFAELREGATVAEQRSPDAWSVVRILRSGGAVTVGRGTRPLPTTGPETLALTTRGIVSIPFTDARPTLVVASPVPVLDTPMAIGGRGTRLAWVNPADHSIQIFERAASQQYVPITVLPNTLATSLVFSASGEQVLFTHSRNRETTLTGINVADGLTQSLGSVSGIGTLTHWYAR